VSVYLNTLGEKVLTIAVCDRCKMKAKSIDLVSDPNAPGLRVHAHCADEFDPWRLPARSQDKITVEYPRPEVPLVVPDDPYNDPENWT
jgi:hypothetical protein